MASRTRKTQAKQSAAETGGAGGVSRRGFLGGAAGAAAGAAAMGFPAIVKAQGPVTMRWQSTWPTKDIFHEFAGDFVAKVNNMSGGDLKIELLPAGATLAGRGRRSAAAAPSARRDHQAEDHQQHQQTAGPTHLSPPALWLSRPISNALGCAW